jgi:hypothetical protein
MKTPYAIVIFFMLLAVSLGIYTASYQQFNVTGLQVNQSNCGSTNLNNNTLCINQLDASINSGGVTITNSTKTNSTSSSSGGNCYTGSTWYNDLGCVFKCSIPVIDWIATVMGQTCTPSQLVSSLGIAPAVGVGVIQASGNNIGMVTNNNPLTESLLALGIFLSLGIFAGLMGAGLLARVMVLAGLALSMVMYIEGQLGAFSGMPTLIYFAFNGIVASLLVILIWSAFDSGGIG